MTNPNRPQLLRFIVGDSPRVIPCGSVIDAERIAATLPATCQRVRITPR